MDGSERITRAIEAIMRRRRPRGFGVTDSGPTAPVTGVSCMQPAGRHVFTVVHRSMSATCWRRHDTDLRSRRRVQHGPAASEARRTRMKSACRCSQRCTLSAGVPPPLLIEKTCERRRHATC